MHTVMARSSMEDQQQMLRDTQDITPLTPTQIFFKEEPISLHVDEITPLTPLPVFPKNEPVPSDEDEMTVLTPLEVFPKQELILSDIDEITTLAPLEVYPKEEPEGNPLSEVQPLMPLQVFVKGEPIPIKTEEPVFASLAPLVLKEEPEENLSDASSEDSRSLVINLENTSDISNDSEPVIIEEKIHSYISDYTDSSDKLVINVEDPSRREADPLRLSDDSGQISLDSEEPMHSVNDSGESTSSDSMSPEPRRMFPNTKAYQCMLCRKSFCSALSLQMHKHSHTGVLPPSKHLFDKLLPQLIPPRPPRPQHKCSNCGKSFSQLQLLMRHRLAHLSTALHKPFSLQAQADMEVEMEEPAPAPGTSALPRRAAKAKPAVSHRRRAPKQEAREQLATLPTRHLRRRIDRRRLS